jgi:hypothetical protein
MVLGEVNKKTCEGLRDCKLFGGITGVGIRHDGAYVVDSSSPFECLSTQRMLPCIYRGCRV